MEKSINIKINNEIIAFKKGLVEWIESENLNIIDENGESRKKDLFNYIYDIEIKKIEKEDLHKRLRMKSIVPSCERCLGLRLNGEQCTRKSKSGSNFCGTHMKGIPNGRSQEEPTTENISVQLKEINGIFQYIDTNNNVYSSEDIISKSECPRIIAKWDINENGDYFIY